MEAPTLSDHMQSLFFGGISISLSSTLLAPIDRVKLVIQLQGGFTKDKTSFPRYKGILSTFISLIREQGAQSLWRGNLAHILIFFPAQLANLALLYSMDMSLTSILAEKDPNEVINLMIYRSIALAIPLAASNPFQIAWTKLATDVSPVRQKTSIPSIVRNLFSTNSLFSGFGTMLIGKVLYRPLYFSLYYRLYDNVISPEDGLLSKFLFAQGVTLAAGLVVYPIETVSRRLMLQAGTEQALSGFEIVKEIFKNEGNVFGFYRGWLCMLFSMIVNASVLTAYDRLRG